MRRNRKAGLKPPPESYTHNNKAGLKSPPDTKTGLKPPPESYNSTPDLKPTPEQSFETRYPVDEIAAIPSMEKRECVRVLRYPSLEEVSRLPSSRHFSGLLLLGDDDVNDDNVVTNERNLEPFTVEEEDENRTPYEKPSDEQQKSVSDEDYNVYIEIAPGVIKLLRGSEETQEAWNNGLCEHVCCIACQTELACIWDCEFVYCPECNTISPVATSKDLNGSLPSLAASFESSMSSLLSHDVDDFSLVKRSSVASHGVGLGIKRSI